MKQTLKNALSISWIVLFSFTGKIARAQDFKDLIEVALVKPRIFAGPNRVAVLVGNKNYNHGIPTLTNPHDDVKTMSDSLKNLGFRTEIFYDLDEKGFLNLLKRLPELYGSATLCLFYYSGHGATSFRKNCMVPTDANLTGEKFIHIGEITKFMDRMPIGITIIDACRNDIFQTDSEPEDLNKLVKKSMLLLATHGFQRASDNPNGRISLFLDEFLKHMGIPDMPFQQIVGRTIWGVSQRSGLMQIPEFISQLNFELILKSAYEESTSRGLLRKGDQMLANQQYEEAKDFYIKAFDAGLAEGAYQVGQLFESGYPYQGGVSGQNYDEALKWYEKAALAGNDRAQAKLGKWYLESPRDFKKGGAYILETDLVKAVSWLKKAAGNANANAQVLLGLMYLNGKGVKEDVKMAFKYFGDAAKLGYLSGQYAFGRMHEKGLGTRISLNEAKSWYKVAARQGDELAKEALNRLEKTEK